MTQLEFDRMCMMCVDIVRRNAPIDTGNLRYNAIRFEFINDNKFVIRVDRRIANYMPYTTEPWEAERWQGKKNPNEGWWDKTAQELADFISSYIGETYQKGETNG